MIEAIKSMKAASPTSLKICLRSVRDDFLINFKNKSFSKFITVSIN